MNTSATIKIYSLVSSKTKYVYIASTQGTLESKLAVHKTHYDLWADSEATYHCSFELLKFPDCDIKLLEECTNMSLNEKASLIQKWIDATDFCVNRLDAQEYDRTKAKAILVKESKLKNMRQTYNEKTKQKRLEYIEKNREKIKAFQNTKCSCECGGSYTKANKSNHMSTKKHINFMLAQE
jgi:hypothetical protein